ncbi:MAG: succinate dehydrogenase, cytochrome b556 subunit [Pseudomonadota bacterium]
MKKERPVNLDLSTIKLPAAAKASILHRVSGVVMLIALAFLIWAFSTSLSGPEGFAQIESLMTGFIAKFIAWGILTALGFHLILGVRHWIMDLGYWEELESGRISATVSIVLSIIWAVLVGAWLW